MAYLEFDQISKSFPGVQALDKVSFPLEKASVHALIGENGAGKSTLGKILAGVEQADEGEIRLNGKPIEPANPTAAHRLGIAMVHQELAFCPNLSIAENLCLGDLPQQGGWLNRSEMRQRARTMLQAIEAEMDVDLPIGQLSTAREQLVQIAAAVGTGAEILVMDEPTSSLSIRESEHLFRLIQNLQARGFTILYVSHRMEEIFRLCDHVTVLRDGRHISTGRIEETGPEQVVRQMVGRAVEVHEPEHMNRTPGRECLTVKDLQSPGLFSGISFSLAQGEVLGFAGLVGAGRSEMAQAIFGLDPNATGEIRVAGKPLTRGSVKEALAAGIGLLPEDRKRQGLVLSMNCRENMTLAALDELSRNGVIARIQEREISARYQQRLRVKAPSLDVGVNGLSGGNQQKVALAKWLVRQCKILIVDEPTRGVDVGAKAEIHHLLDELACLGIAILVISSELPEIMTISRRIIVMREGRIAGTLERPHFSEDTLMRLMAGVEQAQG